MKFVVGNTLEGCEVGDFVLAPDGWDDYSFKTRFLLSFVSDDGLRAIGSVKILVRLSEDTDPVLEPGKHLRASFGGLPPSLCCSVGQSNIYYERLAALPGNAGEAVVRLLHDAAFPQVASWWEGTRGWTTSLLRENTAIEAWQDAPSLLRGEVPDEAVRKVVPYEKGKGWARGGPDALTFKFFGDLPIPGRLNVIVGKNGTGKTSLLAGMKNWFSQPRPKGRWDYRPNFVKVLIVSFNPFDDAFYESDSNDASANVRFVGFRPPGPQIAALAASTGAPDRWATELLAAFPDRASFVAAQPRMVSRDETIAALVALQHDEDWHAFINDALEATTVASLLRDAPDLAYRTMSAGQRALTSIYALLHRDLSRNVLVVVDEPENHLHPSLVARFIRHLNLLLADKGAFALVATHSPVIVQECPSQFVWILTREGTTTTAANPSFETFGATVDNITESLFDTDFQASNWKQVLAEMATTRTLEQVEKAVGPHALPPVARSYLAYLLARGHR